MLSYKYDTTLHVISYETYIDLCLYIACHFYMTYWDRYQTLPVGSKGSILARDVTIYRK